MLVFPIAGLVLLFLHVIFEQLMQSCLLRITFLNLYFIITSKPFEIFYSSVYGISLFVYQLTCEDAIKNI